MTRIATSEHHFTYYPLLHMPYESPTRARRHLYSSFHAQIPQHSFQSNNELTSAPAAQAKAARLRPLAGSYTFSIVTDLEQLRAWRLPRGRP